MKLYYSPGACSQAPHILLHELGLDHDAAKVNLKSKTLEDGSSYLQVNPKGAVPALELDSGDVLTENAVILQYLGDRSSVGEVLPSLRYPHRDTFAGNRPFDEDNEIAGTADRRAAIGHRGNVELR